MAAKLAVPVCTERSEGVGPYSSADTSQLDLLSFSKPSASLPESPVVLTVENRSMRSETEYEIDPDDF